MTIYVLESHPLMSKAVAMLLARAAPTTKVVELDKLSSFQTALLKSGPPSLIIVDPTISALKGTEGLRELKQLHPTTPLIVYSSIPAEDAQAACLQAGVDLYIEKTRPIVHTLGLVKGILNKSSSSDTPDTEEKSTSIFSVKLSKRQVQLIHLLDQGLSNIEISLHLDISPHTVKVHLWRLYQRFSVKSRTQLLNIARRNGLI